MISPRVATSLLLTLIAATGGCGKVVNAELDAGFTGGHDGSSLVTDGGARDLLVRGETIKGGAEDAGGGDLVNAQCAPGTRRCDGLVPQACDDAGQWQGGDACATACLDGACTVCTPGDGTCNGNIPQTCSAAGQWQSGTACPYVCAQGQCAGACLPGARQCSGLVPQTCDALGQWQDGAPCPFVCSQGLCTGLCAPGAAGCNGNVPLTCDDAGQWRSGAACPFVCEAGACAGTCTPGARQCRGTVPQLCGGDGRWQDGAACPYVCSAGACTGACVPGARRCASGRAQLCDATGLWQDAPTATRQLLTNPSFDAGFTGWTEVPAGSLIYAQSEIPSLTTAHTPPNLAYLGGWDDADEDLWQSVTIPAATTRAELSFYFKIQTSETGNYPYDDLVVEARSPDGNASARLAHFTNVDAATSWARFSAALPGDLAGRTVELHFHATTDVSNVTRFFLDSMALQATLCE